MTERRVKCCPWRVKRFGYGGMRQSAIKNIEPRSEVRVRGEQFAIVTGGKLLDIRQGRICERHG